MNEKALYKITYGLYVVSAEAEGKSSGCVVNTLAQVTSKPVRLSVAVNKDNLTCELIQKAGRFAAVALDRRADLPFIGKYGFRSGRDAEKYDGASTVRDAAGMPYCWENACARYSCRLINTLDLGTHILFIGEAEEMEVLSEEEPLTYPYYRTVIKGGTPKNAPSYQEK